MSHTTTSPNSIRAISYVLAAAALIGVLELHLLSALIAGLTIWQVGRLFAGGFDRLGLTSCRGTIASATLLAILVSVTVAAALFFIVPLLSNHEESFTALFVRMADIVTSLKTQMPSWIADYLPTTADGMREMAAELFRQHASYVQHIGQDVGRLITHILIGMVVGGLILAGGSEVHAPMHPFISELRARLVTFATAFRQVVFAQVRISLLNTFLTALYLAVVLPSLGIDLPLVKTMIALTFIVGLVPVAGNLISNTVIVTVSLSSSLSAALLSLAFLVAIHKMEYFANAKIIGSRIKAKAWEILLAMVVMEAAFGIAGIVAAPIIYAYAKDELKRSGIL